MSAEQNKRTPETKCFGGSCLFVKSCRDDGFGQSEVVGVVDVGALDTVGDGNVWTLADTAVVFSPYVGPANKEG